ncbi:hypothetical protein MKW92_027664 [Papaver armeniacum]|nr:hypothetical protein MKW92_027664 [Papaver armeniacum]
MVHVFTGESSWFVQLTAIHFAKSGFITCAIDHQGHGFSDGLQCHIPDINPVVDDSIALLIHLRRGKPWDGIVLNGAMCGISPKFKPPWPLEHFLSVVAWVVPTWQVVQERFGEIEVPLLIIHGGDDVVCDPACAEELYKKAASKDKTIRIFADLRHQLVGESQEDVDLVFNGVIEWLRERAERAAAGSDGESSVA